MGTAENLVVSVLHRYLKLVLKYIYKKNNRINFISSVVFLHKLLGSSQITHIK